MSHRRTASRASDSFAPGGAPREEMGDSLADELANAWDDENEDSFYEEPASAEGDGMQTPQPSSPVATTTQATPAANGNAATSPSKRGGVTPRAPASAARHNRSRSMILDRDDDLDGEDEYSTQAAEFPRELEQTIRDVEKLAAQADKSSSTSTAQQNGGKDAVATLLDSLQNLGNQSNLETHASRLITAHASLTSHVAYQTRAVQAVSFPLLSPLSPPPPPDALDALLPLLADAASAPPQPPAQALSAMTALGTASRDAVAALAALSDSLHMSRQAEAAAARRLRSARDGVAEMGREYAAADRGQLYIQAGGWDARLQGRAAAKECRDIVSGFERVCGQMRERLEASAAAAGAAA